MKVGIAEHATTSVRLPFRCDACGHQDVARASGRGRGIHHVRLGAATLLNPERARRGEAEARDEARLAARYDGYLQAHLCQCPRCAKRRPLWVAWAMFLGALWGLVAACIPATAGAAFGDGPALVGAAVWGGLPFVAVTVWRARRLLSDADARVDFADG